MRTYIPTYLAVDQAERDRMRAIEDDVRAILDSDKPPTKAKLADMANRHVVPTASSMLLDLIATYMTRPSLEWFVPTKSDPDYQAWRWGQRLHCWPGKGLTLVIEPRAKLRAREDIRATYARIAAGDLPSWPAVDRVGRALWLLRKLVPASIEARRHG